jgi:hypothetical protein
MLADAASRVVARKAWECMGRQESCREMERPMGAREGRERIADSDDSLAAVTP